jgi:hypothetical protein
MGCCKNFENNLIRKDYENLSNSFNLNGLKKNNFKSDKISNSIPIDEETINSFYNSNSNSKRQLDKYKKFNILDNIKEVESEYKESSVNTRLLSREIISPQNKFKIIQKMIKNNFVNRKNKIKTLRRNRSLPKYKLVLSEDIFNKKLNEYNENNKNNINYKISLKKSKNISESEKDNIILRKITRDFSFKSIKHEKQSLKNYKRKNRNRKFGLMNETSS